MGFKFSGIMGWGVSRTPDCLMSGKRESKHHVKKKKEKAY